MYNFEIENKFFKNIDELRASKIYSHYELFKKSADIKGDIVEFGVFKGNSLNRLIIFRNFFCRNKKIYGFDMFKKINLSNKDMDYERYNSFLKESKNFQPTLKQIVKSLKKKNFFKNIKLVQGDVRQTLKKIKFSNNISYVGMDLDLYEPTQYVLKNIWNKISSNGIIYLDNYKVFKGETKAVNEFLKEKGVKINKLKLFRNFYYIVKK